MTERPAGRGSYHHGALPEALVGVAFELLDELGQEQVTMREVARRAGVSAGAPFRHFADRRALLTAVADRVLADFEAWQRAEVATATGAAGAGEVAGTSAGAGDRRAVLRALGLGFVRYAVRHPHRFALVRSRVFAPAPQPELRERLSGIDRAYTEVIVADQAAGLLRPGDPELAGFAGQALVYGLAQMILDGYLPAERAEEVAAQVLDTFGRGIANPR
ncbi:TetR/AcrR family transcriptional regulator [Kitasatospora purpeofusca]|uniref:TetR/AcrR family transcriptional regulator n=1 Tax=Kitasatospora purpeofusca TaxID=67352 RepID=UPI00224F486B|nr:TetR/AcrR family transcriptional regulator [Kitasatospora purpeofusca]MCX4758273.1 TetR/AcrR family transcriptional regulator [Kitasatospora purpeofusca]WSR31270.1 TetR/AcrR family transcriptional regulator [Kitasatospora purpeofusca]